MNEQNLNNNGSSNTGAWWVPGMRIFSEISTWIAFPAILAVIGGKALDNHFGTAPWLLITLVCIAFLLSAYGSVKSVRQYAKKIKKEENKL